MGLSSKDKKLLEVALNHGHELELLLLCAEVSPGKTQPESLELSQENFRKSLNDLNSADSELLKKQAQYAEKVNASHGAKHITNLIVPLERLMNRNICDEEFLYDERDLKKTSSTTTDVQEKQPRIVICENLRSGFNVGAIFRTAECFLANEVWLTGYTAPPGKTAMGTDKIINSKSFDHTKIAISHAKRMGYQIIGLEVRKGATPIDKFIWPEKSAIVLGNERFGLDSESLTACDHIVQIPMGGQKNSLNVGIAFGIAASRWRDAASQPEVSRTNEALKDFTNHNLRLEPIGFIKNGFLSPQATPRQGRYHAANSQPLGTELVLTQRFQGAPFNHTQVLKDLDGFSHLWVLFGFHHSSSWKPLVKPPRGDGTLRGVFATRAPHRPNPIGISCVRLNQINGKTLFISDHDLLDGTPIYDIKPYVSQADTIPDAISGWVEALPQPYTILKSEIAERKIQFLETHGEPRLGLFLEEQLRFQPFDLQRKRIELLSHDHFVISFRTWRVAVKLLTPMNSSAKECRSKFLIEDIFSGYSAAELLSSEDVYRDKALHQNFLLSFEKN